MFVTIKIQMQKYTDYNYKNIDVYGPTRKEVITVQTKAFQGVGSG